MKTLLIFLVLNSMGIQAQELPYITIDFRFENPNEQMHFNPYENNSISVVVHNHSPCLYSLYETWNTWGYYTFSFLVETKETSYEIKHQQSLWFRNYASTLDILPGDSAVFHFQLRDSAFVDDLWEEGWVGLPLKLDGEATVRVKYALIFDAAYDCSTDRIRIEDYIEYLDGDIESTPVNPEPKTKYEEPKERTKLVDENLLLGTFYSEPQKLRYE